MPIDPIDLVILALKAGNDWCIDVDGWVYVDGTEGAHAKEIIEALLKDKENPQ